MTSSATFVQHVVHRADEDFMSSEKRFVPELVSASSQASAFGFAKYKRGDVIDRKEVTSVDVTSLAPGTYIVRYGWRKYDPIASLMERSSFVFYAGSCVG